MKYAFALAGGGTRGAFEVGVWKALKELGIEIEAIAGTSIGAVNGAIFASGTDGAEMWKRIKATDVADISGSNLFSITSIIPTIKKLQEGGIDSSAFKDLLDKNIDENTIRTSGIDYGLCTFRTDTKKCEELFLEKIPNGKLTEYIMASASFPLFKPTQINGVSYSDGGLRNNLPINMLIERGYKNIISVSVKGLGIVKNIDRCGVNIIEINCRTPEVGFMDFDTDSIAESIKSGYFECMRVFGEYFGKHYSIERKSYLEARMIYGPALIRGLEDAAKLCKINPYRVYTFNELKTLVLKSFNKNTKLRLAVYMIKKKLPGSSFYDSFKKVFSAANAVVYLLNERGN